MSKHDADEIGRVLGAEFFHNAGAVHLDRARADAQLPSGFLVGGSGGNPPQDLALAPGQQLSSGEAAGLGIGSPFQ